KVAVFRGGSEEWLTAQIEGLSTAPHATGRTADGRDLFDQHWPAGDGPRDHGAAVAWLLPRRAADTSGWRPAAVGHRVVHGGMRFTRPVRLTPEVEAGLRELSELAPLHNPPSLAAIAAARTALPDVPHVAVFDTAFHATLPPHAYVYPVPYRWTAEWGLRRFGFHGLSHAYCAERAAELLNRSPAGLRLVIAHLGHGASLTAVRDGRSLDTTMGFTPLDGVMMATRSGSVDPGLLTHVLRHHGLSADDLDHALNFESGLLGVSGVSPDLRQVREAAATGHE